MRFYFDLQCGHNAIRDDEGVDAADLEEALEAARDVLREMHESEDLPGDAESWQMLIRGEEGAVLATLPVR